MGYGLPQLTKSWVIAQLSTPATHSFEPSQAVSHSLKLTETEHFITQSPNFTTYSPFPSSCYPQQKTAINKQYFRIAKQ